MTVLNANSLGSIRKASGGIFVTASDTDAGKTFVSRLLLRYLRSAGWDVGAYKPVASGVDQVESSDPFLLWSETDRKLPCSVVCPQCFRAPLAPCLAAELEGKSVSEDLLLSGMQPCRNAYEFTVVEGAGGLLSPLTWTVTNAHLAKLLNFPILLVVPDRLGAVNQSLSALLAARQFGLDVRWLALNTISPGGSDNFGHHRRLLDSLWRGSGIDRPPTVFQIRYSETAFPPLDLG